MLVLREKSPEVYRFATYIMRRSGRSPIDCFFIPLRTTRPKRDLTEKKVLIALIFSILFISTIFTKVHLCFPV